MKKKAPVRVNYQKLESDILTALEVADANVEAVYPFPENHAVEMYVVKSVNDILPVFPRDPTDNSYMLPLDMHPAITTFVYYGETPRDIPKLGIVLENLASEPVYVENKEGLAAHEIGHTVSWSRERGEKFKTELESALGPDYSTIEDVAFVVSQMRAEAIAIDAGYERQLLNIRKFDMKRELRNRKLYESELGNIMTLYTCFKLIERNTKDETLKKEAIKLTKELDARIPKKLEEGHSYYRWLRDLTLWAIDSESFKGDLKSVVKRCEVTEW